MRKSSSIKKTINNTIDQIDIIIIKRLLKNSRTSFAEIAKECKVSTLTIKNRYSRLKKTGIIKGSTVIATEEDLHGVEGIVDSGITVNKPDIDQFIKYVHNLFQNKKNYWAFPVHFNEKYNVSVTVLAKSIREIQEIKDALMRHPAVISISLAIWTAIRNIPQNLDPEPFR
jgi:DNA-binding Lrp family transcriptional regulator